MMTRAGCARSRAVVIALVMVSLPVLWSAPAQARPCGSAKAFAKELWKKYGELARKYCDRDADVDGHGLRRTVNRCAQKTLADARIKAGLARHFRKISATKNLVHHPKRLTFAGRRGSLTGTLGRTWILPAPYEQDRIAVELQKLDGKGKASVEVCKWTPDGGAQQVARFTVAPGKQNQGKTWRRSIRGVEGTIVSVTVDGKSATKKIEYKLRAKRPGQGRLKAVKKNRLGPVKGFADLHAHHMAHLGFAGAWLWPAPDEQLKACTGYNHGRVPLDGYPYRSKHPDRTRPGVDWPHHMDTAHQQMHASQLKAAHDNGLSLIVAPVVSNEWVAELLTAKRTRDDDIPRDDMDNARLQIRAIHAFAETYPWYRIARDPWEARQIIHDGDLAVVIAIEVSDFMPAEHGDWEHQLEELYDLGVRSVELAHETDSDFSGAAVHHGWKFKLMQKLKATAKGWRFKTKDTCQNAKGLTPAGRDLVRELARRKMLLEIDHMSREARKDVYELVTDRSYAVDVSRATVSGQPRPERLRYYPLFFSHSRFDALIPGKEELASWPDNTARGIGKSKLGEKEAKATKADTMEYMALDHEVLWVMDTGGVFGLRTGPNAMLTYRKSGVANTCHTSSRSFAQMWAYGLKRFGVAMALGSDLNGFVPQVAPRFGNQACSKLSHQRADDPRRGRPVGGTRLHEFDTDGLKHIGMEPFLIKDLENLGQDMETMHSSAESFLRMWERAYDSRRGRVRPALYRKMMGTPAPTDARRGDREATYPPCAGKKKKWSGATPAPSCPRGYGYETRNPLNKDRCRRRVTRTARLECKLLITDKAKNWTGPHAQRGADECRSRRGKKPKGVKCPRGYKHEIRRGADRCKKTSYEYRTPTCPAGFKYRSRRGQDGCVKK